MNEPGYLDSVLAHGADKAHVMVDQTLQQVKEKVGFLPAKLP